MSPYEVLPAELRDAKAIADLHAVSLRAAFQGIVPDDQLDALAPATREAKWRQAIEFAEPQVHVRVSTMNESEVAGSLASDPEVAFGLAAPYETAPELEYHDPVSYTHLTLPTILRV